MNVKCILHFYRLEKGNSYPINPTTANKATDISLGYVIVLLAFENVHSYRSNLSLINNFEIHFVRNVTRVEYELFFTATLRCFRYIFHFIAISSMFHVHTTVFVSLQLRYCQYYCHGCTDTIQTGFVYR